MSMGCARIWFQIMHSTHSNAVVHRSLAHESICALEYSIQRFSTTKLCLPRRRRRQPLLENNRQNNFIGREHWAAWVTSDSSQNRATHGPIRCHLSQTHSFSDSIFLVSAPGCRFGASADWLNFLFDICVGHIAPAHFWQNCLGECACAIVMCNVCIFVPMSVLNFVEGSL